MRMKNKVTLNCKECSASYEKAFALRDSSKFCSNKCRGLSQSKTNTGEANPNFKGGKSMCMDCKKNLGHRYTGRGETRCKSCNYQYAIGEKSTNWKGGVGFPECVNCSAKTGDTKSVLCRNCYKGALHPFWKGGTSTVQSLIRGMKENRQWIKQCMYRDRYECQECKVESKGNNLQVHHKKQFAQILQDNKIDSVEAARVCEELWDMDNGVTLCISCHKLTESFNRKLS